MKAARLALVLAAVAASIPHTAAVAGPVVPVDTPAAVAVDDARDHVFIAGGDVVAVTDTQGDEVATLDLPDGADARDLAIEGTTLFVSLRGLDAVARYDLTTLEELSAIDLPDPVSDPTNLALSGGSLWVSWGACGSTGGLASIDGDAVEVYPSDELPFLPGDCAVPLVSSPALDDRLFLWNMQAIPVPVIEVDTSVAPPVEADRIDDVFAGFRDAALSPDGSNLYLLQQGRGTRVLEYNTSDLTPTGTTYDLGVDEFTSSIATSSLGEIIVDLEAEIRGFMPGIEAPRYREVIAGGPFGLSEDGERMYLINGDPARFQVLYPLQRDTHLDVELNRNRVVFGESITFTGHLELKGEPPENDHVQLVRQFIRADPRVIARRTVGAAGNFTFTTRPQAGAYYWISYGGDRFHQDDRSRVFTVGVRPVIRSTMVGHYAISHGYHLYRFTDRCSRSGRGCPTMETRLRPKGRELDYHIQVFDGGWISADGGQIRAGAGGVFTLRIGYRDRSVIGARVRVRMDFNQSRHFLPAEGPWEYFRVT